MCSGWQPKSLGPHTLVTENGVRTPFVMPDRFLKGFVMEVSKTIGEQIDSLATIAASRERLVADLRLRCGRPKPIVRLAQRS